MIQEARKIAVVLGAMARLLTASMSAIPPGAQAKSATPSGAGAESSIPPAAQAASALPVDGWPRDTPGAVGLDAGVLDAFDQDIAAGKYQLIDSFQVFRCGKEVFERRYAHDYAAIYGREAHTRGPLNARLTGRYNYFDPAWHPYFKDTPLHSMQSVSKSVTSIIIGIAMTRGDFKAGVDTPVMRYFGAQQVKNLDERKRRMTLKDVLTMTTGLQWNEDVPYDDPTSDSSLMEATDDWVRYVIDKPMAADPGTLFNYSSGATELLAYIFKQETGQDIDAYGERHLFAPLGIRHHWKRTYLGVVDTEGGLYLDGADLAKLGLLYLNDGLWGGKRLVASAWIRRSLMPYTDARGPFKYGYQWWLYPRQEPGRFDWMALGFGGQKLMVFPQENMIVTFTGWEIIHDDAHAGDLVNRLLPAVKDAACAQAPALD
jgi:CubicO group peptidase (beta-lactamase class C family)